MAVRRQVNRGHKAIFGQDFKDVLKRGKIRYRASEVFEVWEYADVGGVIYCADAETYPGLKPYPGTKRYRFDRNRGRWFLEYQF